MAIFFVFCIFLGASLLFISHLSSAITSAVSASVMENAQEVQEKVQEVFHRYAKALQALLLSLRNHPENIEGKVTAACVFPEIEAIHYYYITPQGVIVRTNYPEDLGLDLSAFPQFWRALKRELDEKPVVVHPFALETRTGRIRMYLYTRTESGEILELGATLRQDFLNPFFKNIKQFTRLPFVQNVGLYSAHLLPVASAFPPLSENLRTSILSAPQKTRFGLVRQEVVRRIAVPLVGDVATVLYVVTEFDFAPLYILAGALLCGGLLFLVYLTGSHKACFHKIARDLATLSTIARGSSERERERERILRLS